MPEREQKRRQAPSRETEAVAPVAPATERGEKLKAEIDDVLEENAEEFVRSYVQKGGE